MFSDGYENYCNELIDYAKGSAPLTQEEFCACAETNSMPNSDIAAISE